MKFRDRLKYAAQILTGKNDRGFQLRQPTQTRQMPFSLPVWGRHSEIAPLVNYESYVNEGYKLNPIIYSCIRKIARTAPAANLVIEREIDGQREIVANHVLLETFQNPNPYLSAFDFKVLVHTYLNLVGEVYVIKVGFGGRVGRPTKPGEFYLPRPDLMRPVPSKNGNGLDGFVYVGLDGKRVPFGPDEVIHIKYYDPADPFNGFGRGLSPLSAAARMADIDNRMTVMIRDFFEGGAIVSGLLKVKHQIIDDDEMQRLHNRLKLQYSMSSDKQWYDMILDADADYQRIGLYFDEMALPDLRSLAESRVCSVFDIPA